MSAIAGILFLGAGFLTINTAVVRSAGLDAVLRTNGVIPKDGSGGAFGQIRLPVELNVITISFS